MLLLWQGQKEGAEDMWTGTAHFSQRILPLLQSKIYLSVSRQKFGTDNRKLSF